MCLDPLSPRVPLSARPVSSGPPRLSLGDRGCAEISPQSAATAPSYQEYQLAPKVDCLKYTRTYPCCDDVPWTQLWIVFYIQRSSNYYFLVAEFPSILITVLSFGQFWMEDSGRIGFGATMFLTSYVLSSISLDSLPRCGELLWLNLFNLVNFIFCVTALLQTTIVVRLVSHKKACDAAVPSAAVAAGVVPAAAAAGEDHGCVCGDRKKIAKKIDFWSRRCIPVAYFFSVWFVYGLTLVDSYSISSTDGRVSKDDVVSSLPMYQGLCAAPRSNPRQRATAPCNRARGA